MYKNKRILALIPARGGSKGIKDKNITKLCGKPLIAYTIEAARKCSLIDSVVVSTDSSTIAKTSLEYGASVPFLRPDYLADDHSRSIDAVIHAVEALKSMGKDFDILILLQPTSPLRTAKDLHDSIIEFFDTNAESLVSISPVSDSPVLIRSISEDGRLNHLINTNSTIRRQDMKAYYVVNGAIYINYIKDLNSNTSFNDNTHGFIMDSSHSIDIDEPLDLAIAEALIESKSTL